MSQDNGKPYEPARSRMDSTYLERRTEMFQRMRMEGYWRIGSGKPENVPKKKAKRR